MTNFGLKFEDGKFILGKGSFKGYALLMEETKYELRKMCKRDFDDVCIKLHDWLSEDKYPLFFIASIVVCRCHSIWDVHFSYLTRLYTGWDDMSSPNLHEYVLRLHSNNLMESGNWLVSH